MNKGLLKAFIARKRPPEIKMNAKDEEQPEFFGELFWRDPKFITEKSPDDLTSEPYEALRFDSAEARDKWLIEHKDFDGLTIFLHDIPSPVNKELEISNSNVHPLDYRGPNV